MRHEFGTRLAAARRQAGLTQQQLAQTIGRSRSSVANMEAGRQEPGLAGLAGLATALGVSCDTLLGVASPAAGVDLAAIRADLGRRAADHRYHAEQCWQAFDAIRAAYHRGIADGLNTAMPHK